VVNPLGVASQPGSGIVAPAVLTVPVAASGGGGGGGGGESSGPNMLMVPVADTGVAIALHTSPGVGPDLQKTVTGIATVRTPAGGMTNTIGEALDITSVFEQKTVGGTCPIVPPHALASRRGMTTETNATDRTRPDIVRQSRTRMTVLPSPEHGRLARESNEP